MQLSYDTGFIKVYEFFKKKLEKQKKHARKQETMQYLLTFNHVNQTVNTKPVNPGQMTCIQLQRKNFIAIKL